MKLPAILLSLAALCGMNLRADPLAIGAKVPALDAVDENGAVIDLGAKFSNGLTLVYFYPKADTPGCTAQACSLRDSIGDLKDLGVEVVGVSRDKPEAQKRFKEKYDLPFTLIADTDGKVVEAFGVPTLPMGMPKRQSFLVKNGKVAWRSLNAETAGHAQEVAAAVAGLK